MGEARSCSCHRAMRLGERFGPDWRNAAAYAPLLAADRSLLAWEWLRRDKAYRRASRMHWGSGTAGRMARPERWGLHAFEPPDLAIPHARPVWRAERHPYVLPVHAIPGPAQDAFDLKLLAPQCRLVAGIAGREHLLICDGLRSIRIDVLKGSLRESRARLHYLIAGFECAEKPLLTLRRLLAFCRTGHFSASLHRSEARARRYVLMLRAADALASGAVQREIAAELLDGDARADRWRVRTPSLRSRVQRLVGNARAMTAGLYWSLLDG